MLKAINIDWETDGENVDLPSEVNIPVRIEKTYREDKNDYVITDWLSDEFGWLVNSYEIKDKNKIY